MLPPPVKDLNYRHEAIAEWLVCNPDKLLKDCADFFGYTQAWLSRVINSDMFQEYYRKLCTERNTVAIHGMAARLNHMTVTALDKTIARLETNTGSEKFIQESLKTGLEALGVINAPVALGSQFHQHNHLHVDAVGLKEAREKALELMRGSSPAKLASNITSFISVVPGEGA